MDAYGEDEQLWAFLQAFEDNILLPADVCVIGEPVSVTEIDYDGNTRRGLIAVCRKTSGAEYVIALSETVFPEGAQGARYVAAYLKWLHGAHVRHRTTAARRGETTQGKS